MIGPPLTTTWKLLLMFLAKKEKLCTNCDMMLATKIEKRSTYLTKFCDWNETTKMIIIQSPSSSQGVNFLSLKDKENGVKPSSCHVTALFSHSRSVLSLPLPHWDSLCCVLRKNRCDRSPALSDIKAMFKLSDGQVPIPQAYLTIKPPPLVRIKDRER